MKRFIGFVKKEFYHIFRDYRTMIILFGMPVAQILIFGFVISNEIKNVNIAIYDKSKDYITQEITNKILSSGYFILAENLSHSDEIHSVFKSGKAKEVIVFESDFAKKLLKNGKASVQLLADASDANTANLILNYTSAIIQKYSQNKSAAGQIPMQIIPETRMMYNESLKGVYMFVPGTIALILMLVSAMMTSISITREKEMGSMEILLVSPLKPIQIILGKVAPYLALSFVNAVTIILLGYFVFEVPVQGSVILLMFETVLFILMALSLGILISTAAKSQQTAMFISMFALMLPTMLLSGFIFPIENMPRILQWLAQCMPPKYFIVAIKNIMLKGTGMAYVWKETLVIAGLTIFFIILSLKKYKVRLE
ncbi:MAG: ABC transporter permease [Bacteroidales bacterium]|nr:ABC transporter permease [Bacteroidales bacterium]